MSIAAAPPAPELPRRIVRLQMLAIVWMNIEAIVALEKTRAPKNSGSRGGASSARDA
jgi:hypothetical protein